MGIQLSMYMCFNTLITNPLIFFVILLPSLNLLMHCQNTAFVHHSNDSEKVGVLESVEKFFFFRSVDVVALPIYICTTLPHDLHAALFLYSAEAFVWRLVSQQLPVGFSWNFRKMFFLTMGTKCTKNIFSKNIFSWFFQSQFSRQLLVGFRPYLAKLYYT